MAYSYRVGVMVPFVQKYFKQLMFAVAAIFMATFAMSSLITSAATPAFNSFTDTEIATWITDRTQPSSVDSVSTQGRTEVLEIKLDAETRSTLAPFHYTEGIQKRQNFGNSINADLYVDSAWDTLDVRAGLWGIGIDAPDSISAYPIVEFTTMGDAGFTGWRVWNGTGWENTIPATYNEWASLKIELVGSEFKFSVNGNEIATTNAEGTASIDGAIFNSFNNGVTDYTVLWHNGVLPDTTAPSAVLASYAERPSGDSVVNGGTSDSLMFTFNLSATGDPARYQLKYWNDIIGSPYKQVSPWNPTDLSGYSTGLGIYNDQFTQGEGVHYFSFSACDAANNCSDYSAPFVVIYDSPATVEVLAAKGDCKNNGWVLGALANGSTFKNQGDCVSYFATKFKNQPAGSTATTTARR